MTNRYENSKVYKLIDEQGYYYYGSTCLPLHKRAYNHRKSSKNETNRKIYSIFTHERFINNEIKIVLVEEFKLANKEQLLQKENEYIEKYINDPFCLNTLHAILSLEKRIEMKRECDRLYREANIEKIREYDHERDNKPERKENKRKNCIIRRQNAEVREQRKQKMTCICGSVFNKEIKKRHERTKKHLDFINNQQQ